MIGPTMAGRAGKHDMASVRTLLGRHLAGSGVELGPGPKPYPIVFPGVEVAYVDRRMPEENQRLFDEVEPESTFPVPDYVCDLDTDRLNSLSDNSQDFVIASHVLEHVAEPIGLLNEIYRVLRPGGIALILLPDRRRTFDRHRRPTPLDHLVAEFHDGITEVSDRHILEFLEAVGDPDFRRLTHGSEEERRAILERHRQRSIHVHCWTEDEFVDVLLHVIRHVGHRWEFIDGVTADDEGPSGIEFGYVLRRSTADLPAESFGLRFEATWRAWVRSHYASQRHGWGELILHNLRQLIHRLPWAHALARRARQRFKSVAPGVHSSKLKTASSARTRTNL
jgi:SAM-dependent methyltransferase